MSGDSGPVRDWHQIAVELMMTDAELALQSVACLLETDDQQAVAWVVRNARETYDSICERRRTTTLSEGEAASLDDKLERLRARLRFLGDPV
jgi:hypothetical protein